MQDLEFLNKKCESKVKTKQVLNHFLVLRRAKILKPELIDSLEGYVRIPNIDNEHYLYTLYYNDNLLRYILVADEKKDSIKGYVLDYADEELVTSLVEKCKYLQSSYKTEEVNGYKMIGGLVVILSFVFAIFGGEGGPIILILGLFISALYFGIGKIVKDLEEIKNQK